MRRSGLGSEPPFCIRFVKAGSRIGYRWETSLDQIPCEVNWLDPEPDRESSDYEAYIKEKDKIEDECQIYTGFYEPPTEEEYLRRVEEARDIMAAGGVYIPSNSYQYDNPY